MNWKIKFESRTWKDLKKLGKQSAKQVLKYLYDRVAVADNPALLGRRLLGEKCKLHRFRMGNIRIIADVQYDEIAVLVIKIAGRDKVYR